MTKKDAEILGYLSEGKVLVGRRYFPNPWSYGVYASVNSSEKLLDLSEASLVRMVAQELVTPAPLTPEEGKLREWYVTQSGRNALAMFRAREDAKAQKDTVGAR